MSLRCSLGLHDLSKDCEKCSKCGAASSTGHQWDRNCEKCSKCGKTRYSAHEWTGCKCSKCGTARDEGHEWMGSSCRKCGTTRAAFDAREAAKAGDVAKLAGLLSNDPNLVRSKDHSGWTPLHRAAYEGQRAAAELLLGHGADVNAKATDRYTPLHAAALSYKKESKREVLEMLLANKADPNAKTEDDLTPLHIVAFGGEKDATELLLPKTQRNKDDMALNMAIVNTLEPGFDPTRRMRL